MFRLSPTKDILREQALRAGAGIPEAKSPYDEEKSAIEPDSRDEILTRMFSRYNTFYERIAQKMIENRKQIAGKYFSFLKLNKSDGARLSPIIIPAAQNAAIRATAILQA